MTGKQFKNWMKEHGLRVTDIASKTKLGTNTIYDFRRGKDMRPTTVSILLQFVQQYEQTVTSHGGKRAPG